MARREGGACGFGGLGESWAYWERVAMRNALGLMLASVLAAAVIAGVWYWTSAPRADAAPPKTIAARPAEPAKLAAKDDVETTASLQSRLAALPAAAAQAA